MKSIFYVLCLLLFGVSLQIKSGGSQDYIKPVATDWQPSLSELQIAKKYANQVDITRLMNDVTWLADDRRAGRLAGTSAEDEVGLWLINYYKKLNIKPFSEIGLKEYSQSFPIPALEIESDSREVFGENIVGVLYGSEKMDEFVIVSSHYDHLGVKDGIIYNGADDDATGVAAMLEIMRLFSQSKIKPKRSIIFVAFSAEEIGQGGANVFCEHIRLMQPHYKFVNLNLEMFGAAQGKGTYINIWDYRNIDSNAQVAAVHAASQALQFPMVATFGTGPVSDAKTLLECGVAATTIDVAGGKELWVNHPHYHSPFDDHENIDQLGFYKGTQIATIAVWLLANDSFKEVSDRS